MEKQQEEKKEKALEEIMQKNDLWNIEIYDPIKKRTFRVYLFEDILKKAEESGEDNEALANRLIAEHLDTFTEMRQDEEKINSLMLDAEKRGFKEAILSVQLSFSDNEDKIVYRIDEVLKVSKLDKLFKKLWK